MFLSIATTHKPATDLGFLLMKNPDRMHEFELSFGRAVVFFPEATEERCEATMVLDIDPVSLVRGKGMADGVMDQYVNDRPYAASSFLSVAINRVFGSALAGRSRDRPALAETAIPLEIVMTPVPIRQTDGLAERLFAPLGWSVETSPVTKDGETSAYVNLRLKACMRLAEALSHVYVLVSALDSRKHYWVGEDEIEKLLAKAGEWLSRHPERELIAGRYLKHRRDLLRTALSRLNTEETESPSAGTSAIVQEEVLEKPFNLHDLRLDIVADLVSKCGATSVADLGCGEGKLLSRLARNRKLDRIIGLDVSTRSLERAAERLKLNRPGDTTGQRVTLLHGALTYRDARWSGVDVAVLVEVIEHLEVDRLPALCDAVFGAGQAKTVIITTPNADYNILFPNLPAKTFRHPDHRFEWGRAEFRNFITNVEEKYGYRATILPIGDEHPLHGPVSQMAVLKQ